VNLSRGKISDGRWIRRWPGTTWRPGIRHLLPATEVGRLRPSRTREQDRHGRRAPDGARQPHRRALRGDHQSPPDRRHHLFNSGGNFRPRSNGHDAIIIEGRSTTPVYLWIDGDRVELRPAGHLWGKTTHETDDALRGETHAKAKTAVIGPAGEKQVLFASIMNDRDRAAGRAAVGAGRIPT
jgi:hypothetical protein